MFLKAFCALFSISALTMLGVGLSGHGELFALGLVLLMTSLICNIAAHTAPTVPYPHR